MSNRGGEPVIYLISVKDDEDKKEIKDIVEKIKRANRKAVIVNVSREQGIAIIELPSGAPIHKFKKDFNFNLVVG